MSLRRVAMMAALAALLPAGTAEAKKVAKPVVTKVAPKNVSVGETLTVYGRNFKKGKGVNSVVFKRDGSPAVFVKADVSTRRQIKVIVPDSLAKYLVLSDGNPSATTFRIRVLAARFGKSFTALKKSPVISPAKPPEEQAAQNAQSSPDGDCDGDKVPNSVDPDDDGDLLSDNLEKALGTDACLVDSDEDGVSDAFEFQSARDLNDDNYGSPNNYVNYPGRLPYSNPLVADATVDYDGDGLNLLDEYRMWRGYGEYKTTDGQPLDSTSTPQRLVLNYSDGKQSTLDISAAGYDKQAQFLATAAAEGYSAASLTDFDSGFVPGFSGDSDYLAWFDSSETPWYAPDGAITDVERYYYDRNHDGKLSDDERDEDADGLTNWFEAHGPMTPAWWKRAYDKEGAFVVAYAGTDVANGDSDGDGVVDGADDQDHDDLPNVREISRQLVAGELKDGAPNYMLEGAPAYVRYKLGDNPDNIVWNRPREGSAQDPLDDGPWRAWVQPFNPCLPDPRSATCQRYPNRTALYPPFDAATPRFNVFDGTDVMPG